MNLSALRPAAALWRGSQVNGIEHFAVDLDPEEDTTLEAAAIELSARAVNPTDMEPSDLPLGRLAETIGKVREELLYGSGMVLLRGLPADRLSSREIALYFWGVGLRLGRAVSQSVMGERLGRVVDVTDVDPHARAYRNRSELTPHTDPADLVAFLSRITTLVPGDIIFIGTPAGIGAAQGLFLADGDVITTTIDKIGTMANTCVRVADWR